MGYRAKARIDGIMSKSTTDILIGFICGFLLAANIVLFGLADIYHFSGKAECESQLPRNIQCIWQAPDK